MTKLVSSSMVFLVSCVGQGGFSVGGQSSTGPAAATVPSPGTTTTSSGGPEKDLDADAFYTVSTTVGGQELAITFIPPADLERGESITNNARKSKVEPRPLTKGKEQQWQFHPEGKNEYTIWPKVSDFDDRPSGVLRLYGVDKRFIPTPEFRAGHNRLTVGINNNEPETYWFVVKTGGGFQIRSSFGTAERLNKPNEKERSDLWDEERTLGIDGMALVHVKLGHPQTTWKLTKVGY